MDAFLFSRRWLAQHRLHAGAAQRGISADKLKLLWEEEGTGWGKQLKLCEQSALTAVWAPHGAGVNALQRVNAKQQSYYQQSYIWWLSKKHSTESFSIRRSAASPQLLTPLHRTLHTGGHRHGLPAPHSRAESCRDISCCVPRGAHTCGNAADWRWFIHIP